MRTDFVSDGGSVDELLLTMGEMAGTPGGGKTIVSKNADRIMDCKDDERQAITRIFCILFEKGKLSSSDIQDGLVDTIEFIDSLVCDAPKAYDYLGDVLGEMLRIKAAEMSWLCEQAEKTKVDGPGPAEKIVRATLNGLKKSGGDSTAREIADKHANELSNLLGADTWKAVSESI
jgi:hypothetical protein